MSANNNDTLQTLVQVVNASTTNLQTIKTNLERLQSHIKDMENRLRNVEQRLTNMEFNNSRGKLH